METDYKPKRCYVDKNGNTIDPRTSWDELLKYYKKYYKLLGTGEHSRQSSNGTEIQALKLVIAEKLHRENKRKAAELEARDLEKKEKQRRIQRRKNIADLAEDYLDKVHKQHS